MGVQLVFQILPYSNAVSLKFALLLFDVLNVLYTQLLNGRYKTSFYALPCIFQVDKKLQLISLR